MDYYKSNQFKLAVAPLQKSIDLNAPMAEPEARFWLAATYSALGRPDEAVHELRRDLILRPKDSDVLYYLVKAYDQSSSAAFERLGRMEPKSAAVALLQGERLAEENRTDVAELQYRTRLLCGPTSRAGFRQQKQKRFSRKRHQPIWLLPHSMPRQIWISRSYSIQQAIPPAPQPYAKSAPFKRCGSESRSAS